MNMNIDNIPAEFTVYLTSTGSKTAFPTNVHTTFSNVLPRPLSYMQNYQVALAACHIPDATPGHTILVCSDIVVPSFFNERQMPIIGIYAAHTGSIIHAYTNLVMNTIPTITCYLLDVNGKKLELHSSPLVVLHFKRKPS